MMRGKLMRSFSSEYLRDSDENLAASGWILKRFLGFQSSRLEGRPTILSTMLRFQRFEKQCEARDARSGPK